MAIYRGIGGSGDSISDATLNEVTQQATNAAASATAAANSAASAAGSAGHATDVAANLVLTNADVVLTHADVVLTHADVVTAEAAKVAAVAAEATALSAEADAQTFASNAAASGAAAIQYATLASGFSVDASGFADDAAATATSIGNLSTALTAANTSATTATTKASEAATSATLASGSAGTAATKASEASSSAGTAATKASEAATSASLSAASVTAAATSASNATSSAATAAVSAALAVTEAAAAQVSEDNADTSESNAALSASAAATSEATATTKASEASASAATATTQAGIATTKASEAATSASSASANASTVATTATAFGNVDGAVTSAQSAQSGAETAKSGAESARDQAYTYSQSAASAVAYQDLTAIAESKSDTAVDVFVYDTSKDSDGGAWRKRTQGTSWYNETLNTSTRGSRKEFPSVAVIVAESNQVTIYDGDDPSMPMWMVFNESNSNMLRISNQNKNHVSARNGIIAIATEGLVTVDFIKDGAYLRYSVAGSSYKSQGISTRNSTPSWNYGETTSQAIANTVTNDIAMTVLPNAPIDSATGLPIPTIAVATDGGVSVIKDDGSVVSGGEVNSSWAVRDLGFDADNAVWGVLSGDSAYGHLQLLSEAPYTSVDTIGRNDGGAIGFRRAITTTHGGDTDNPVHILSGAFKDVSYTDDGVVTAHTNGISLIDHDRTNIHNSMAALLSTSYNTGWMNGDIKLAALSDTDDTDVVGSELVTNGTFDTDTSGWSSGSSALLTHSTDKLIVTNNGVGYGYAYQQITGLVVGETYTISWESPSSDVDAKISVGALGGGGLVNATAVTSKTFIATGTSTYVNVWSYSGNTSASADFDNISVRLGDSDRSVNGNGLQIHGTITKNPVATGADLVGYSGFSASNHLEQPYNSDLDFGTGDFSVMGWFKSSDSSPKALMHRSNASTAGWGSSTILQFETSGNLTKIQAYGSAFVGGSYASVNTSLSDGAWHYVVGVRKDGVLTAYLDGVAGTSVANTVNLSGTTSRLQVGQRGYLSRPFNGSISLFRISATAPTAEQIAKIYEDEKVLFQENAKATLYGSSDAVTALAHDDDTNLLHVGTSAGRSVFQGLRRVDNTTTAVGAAISASNGLVVED